MAPVVLDLRRYPHAEAKFLKDLSAVFPELNDDDLAVGWSDFCKWSAREPYAAAKFENLLRTEGRARLDS